MKTWLALSAMALVALTSTAARAGTDMASGKDDEFAVDPSQGYWVQTAPPPPAYYYGPPPYYYSGPPPYYYYGHRHYGYYGGPGVYIGLPGISFGFGGGHHHH